MDSTCKNCGKQFATKYTCQRHMNMFHKNGSGQYVKPNNYKETSWIGSSQESGSDQYVKPNDYKETNWIGSSQESGSDDESDSGDSSISNSSDHLNEDLNEEDDCNNAWRDVMHMMFYHRHNFPWLANVKKADDLLSEPHLTNFTSSLGDVVEELEDIVDDLHDSELWKSVEQTRQNLVLNENYKPSEARSSAWDSRKALVKEMLNRNIDVVAAHL